MFRDSEMRGQSKRVGYGGVKFARITGSGGGRAEPYITLWTG